jgi:hypothetical protein
MKSLENKVTDIKDGDKYKKYSDLIKLICNMPVAGGFSITDIAMRTKIVDACDSATDKIELEDLRVDYLKAISATSKWGVLHKDLVALSEDIKNGWT